MRSWQKISCFLFVLLLAFGGASTAIDGVHAQEKRSFFDKFFGRKKAPEKQQKAPQRKKSSSRKTAANKRPSPATTVRVEKSADARRILVIGDFIAAHLADGLRDLYADNPDLVVIKQVEAASGLVRDDYYNWSATIDEIVTAQNPDIILIVLGANDRQTLRLEGQTIDYGNEDWGSHYRLRVARLADQLVPQADSRSNSPFWAWFGLPPFQKLSLNEVALALNGIYEEEILKAEGHFIDIWSGFVDDKGNYSASGYDVNGQIARLRNADGINFTMQGRAKLAFYANEAIAAWLARQNVTDAEGTDSESTDADAEGLQAEILTNSDPVVQEIKYVAPQKLWDIMTSETELVTSLPSDPTPRRPLSPRAGRADYFFVE